LQQGAHVFPGWLVERGKRLVEQQQTGLDRQGAGQRHPLLFAAAERSRCPVGEVLDAKLMQQVIGAIRGRCVAGSWPESDVVSDGEVGKQRGVLEDQADPTPLGRQAGDVGSGQADLPGVLRAQPGDGL
jgi:hypothetical protein